MTRDPGYETRDVAPRVPLIAGLAVAAFLLLVLALIAAGFALRGGGAGAPSVGGFAELPLTDDRTPYLQGAPGRDLARMRAISEAGLHDYGWVDRDAGIVHLPIERAMDLYARRHGDREADHE